MERRELLGTLGATAAGLATVAGGKAIAQGEGAHAGGHDDLAHHKCAKDCFDCALECETCFHHCVTQLAAGKQAHAKAVHLTIACADACVTAGRLVARKSPLMVSTCRACAECCDACAVECEKHDDATMKKMAQMCRKCAASCREMIKAMSA